MPAALVVAAVAVFFLVAALREHIDRAAAISVLMMSGARDVQIGSLRSEGGRWILGDLHLRDVPGTLAIDAEDAGIGVDWEGARPYVTLILRRPRITLTASSPSALAGMARAALHAPPFGRGMHVELFDGRVQVVGLRGSPLVADGVSGSLHSGFGRLRYEIHGSLTAGRERYPFAGAAGPEGGSTVHRWEAAILPASLLGTLVDADGVTVRGGFFRDGQVRFSERQGLRADGTLTGVEAVVDGHLLRGLSGGVALDRDEVASNDVTASLGEASVRARGDVRFSDVTIVRELFDRVAGESGLQTIRLESVAPGVAFAKYVAKTDDGPLAVQLLDVNPLEPTLRFDTVLAGDHVFSGAERTSSMADRTGAVAGINGDYFDMGGTSAPQGLMIRDGVLVHSPTELREALVVHRDRSFTFGLYRFHGAVTTSRGTAPITMFNDWPPGDVAVVTPDLGKVPATPGVTFVALAATATPHRYRVESVSPLAEARAAAFGLAFGPLARAKLPRRGEEIEVHYAVTPPVDDAVAAVASGPLLLRHGVWYEDPHAPAPGEREVRWPVVGVGKLPSGRLLWAAVDGRWYDVSIGMTRPEFAALLQRFGVTDAIALDSGGSVTMVSRIPGETEASVRNHPSDSGGERWVANGLFIYSSAPQSALADVLKTRELSQLPSSGVPGDGHRSAVR
jgi:hypothetical protein